MIGGGSRYPFSSFAKRLGELCDYDCLEVEQLVEHAVPEVALPYDILSKEVGWVSPPLPVLDMTPESPLVQQVHLAPILGTDLKQPWGTFPRFVKHPSMLKGCSIALMFDPLFRLLRVLCCIFVMILYSMAQATS